MKLSRRRCLSLAVGAVALPMVPRVAKAQTYPSRPVRIIVPYAPASSPDIVGRIVAQWLTERLGQTFIIENRPGAGGTLGTEATIAAHPDGYTLLYVVTSNAISASLLKHLSFNFIRDIAPTGGILRIPNLITITPSLPVETIPQLIDHAKAHPGKLNFGAPTAGTTLLTAELFKQMTGITLVHVPYNNQAHAVTDLIAGRMQLSFDVMATTIGYARAGTLRALAVTTATRSPAAPDIPAVDEFVPGYEASSWHGLGAPRTTPDDIIDKLNNEITAALADPKVRARIADLGGMPMPMSPAEFGKLVIDETEKWAKVIKVAGLKPA